MTRPPPPACQARPQDEPARLFQFDSPLTVRVYEEICTLARLNAGRVFPSYDHLAEATALGRATIASALTALETAGFLVRQRRFKRVEGEGAGPRYAQTSNAYRPILPQRLLGFLPRRFRPAPVPVCALEHGRAQAGELAAVQATLSCRDLARVQVGGALDRVLAKLGAALDVRESHNDPQPLPISFDKVGIKRRPDRSTRLI